MTNNLLIRGAGVYPDTRIIDVRIANGLVTDIGSLDSRDGETVIDANGGCLLPGLADHHIHLASTAASLASVGCGPPAVTSEKALVETLRTASGNTSWLRGIGYHESVAGDIDRAWLDERGPHRPIRIQHRSGRLWIVNSIALDQIRHASQSLPPEQLARLNKPDGRLFDVDDLLGNVLTRSPPAIAETSRLLASRGVTALNDMTPVNGQDNWHWFQELQEARSLLQKVRMSGREELSNLSETHLLTVGETKFHLHEHALPDFGEFVSAIKRSHESNRGIAVHCVTRTELVFTLAALKEAGSIPADRIEHASVTEDELMEQVAELGVGVVTQPNFIAERGDTYRTEVPVESHPHLYRVAGFLSRQIPTAFGTDAPFGEADPWLAMRAAVNRLTPRGCLLGEMERVDPETALACFLGAPEDPFTPRKITTGAPADLCLLDRPWREARTRLTSSDVALTILQGRITYQR